MEIHCLDTDTFILHSLQLSCCPFLDALGTCLGVFVEMLMRASEWQSGCCLGTDDILKAGSIDRREFWWWNRNIEPRNGRCFGQGLRSSQFFISGRCHQPCCRSPQWQHTQWHLSQTIRWGAALWIWWAASESGIQIYGCGTAIQAHDQWKYRNRWDMQQWSNIDDQQRSQESRSYWTGTG